MKTAAMLLGILFLTQKSFAWTDKIELKDDYAGSDGDANTPAQEMDYAYLFCEEGTKAERAARGEIEWARSSAEEYCRYVHRDDPDSWRDGWRRTRLKRGCLNQLQAFNNYVYRCFDPRTDSSLGDMEAEYNAETTRLWTEWQPLYLEKLRVILEKIEPERHGLEVDVKALEGRIKAAEAAQKKIEQEYELATTKLNAFKAYQDNFFDRLKKQFADDDALAAAVQNDLKKDASDQSYLNDRVQNMLVKIFDETSTLNQIAGLRAEHEALESTAQFAVCAQTRFSVSVQKLRALQAQTEMMLREYKDQLDALKLPATFADAKLEFQKNIAAIGGVISERNTAFSDDVETLMRESQPCRAHRAIPVLIDLRERIFALVNQGTATTELVAKLNQTLTEVLSTLRQNDQMTAGKRSLTQFGAEFAQTLNLGRVNEAIMLSQATPVAIAAYLGSAQASGFYRADQLAELKEKSDQIAQSIAQDASERLVFPAVKAVIKKRTQHLAQKISTARAFAQSSPELAPLLDVVLMQANDLVDSQGNFLPVTLPSQTAVLKYDGRLAEFENLLATFLKDRS